MRGTGEKGITVRHVLPKSPAAELGLKAGDRIITAAGLDVGDAAEMQQFLSGLDPTTKLELEWMRGDKKESGSIQLAKYAAVVPAELPSAVNEQNLPPVAEKPATGVIEIKLPEEKNLCQAIVPENYHPQVPHGVLVHLPPPGAVDKDKQLARWKALAEKNQLIILQPQSADPKKWDPTETAFIRKTLDDLMSHYTIDTTRVAIFGADASGTMAFLTALEHRDRFRGLAAAEAAPPARMKAPETDPVNRLAIFLASAEKTPAHGTNETLHTRFTAAKFPVTMHSLGETARDFNVEDDAMLVRWLDALDRF
jgi:predicted esterase